MQKVVSNHTGAMAFGAEKIYKRQQESDNWQTSFENETIKKRQMTTTHDKPTLHKSTIGNSWQVRKQ